MDNKISIMVVDDDQNVVDGIKKYFSSHEIFNIVNVSTNVTDALKIIKSGYKIDLIIMDIVISGDGITFLEELQKENINTKVIVLSSIKNDYLLKKSSELNIMYYLIKPIELSILEKRITSFFMNHSSVEEVDRSLSVSISKILHDLGVPSHIKGYQYIRESISLLINNPELKGITKEIYPSVAKTYQTTSSRVERAIRHAIEVSWARGDYDLMEEIFGHSVDYDRAKPTNSEFIATVTDKLKLDYKLVNA